MGDSSNETYKKNEIRNLWNDEHNNYSMNESSFMPMIEFGLNSEFSLIDLKKYYGIDIKNDNENIVDYNKLRNYIRINTVIQTRYNGKSNEKVVEWGHCEEFKFTRRGFSKKDFIGLNKRVCADFSNIENDIKLRNSYQNRNDRINMVIRIEQCVNQTTED